MTRYNPLRHLLISRLREFFREPEAIFWVYGFPVLMAVGLGIAFREKPPDQIRVDVQQVEAGEFTGSTRAALTAAPEFLVEAHDRDGCAARLRMGRADITVVPGEPTEYVYDAARPESVLARARVDDALQRAAGRSDRVATKDRLVTQIGSRYIDFLIPGLLGMNLMGGGLWGIGFVTVDMRVRKLLKRLVATPMRKAHFLIALIGSRIVFGLPEIALLLLSGFLFFGVAVRGSLAAVLFVSLVGAISFSGLGLLVACRAQKIETISGLMNVVMLPMWLLSGIFFSSERFPSAAQPFIQALPLTMLNDALRAVILEGASLASQGLRLGGLAAWAGVSFVLAMRWFRWG
ncbi:MAG TPA: ABC transporter permease [Candidatus Polarisedimenticolia bacterium]|nr:ABC transporter permease [Candidatus Polarisedimenticolia bacterium]